MRPNIKPITTINTTLDATPKLKTMPPSRAIVLLAVTQTIPCFMFNGIAHMMLQAMIPAMTSLLVPPQPMIIPKVKPIATSEAIPCDPLQVMPQVTPHIMPNKIPQQIPRAIPHTTPHEMPRVAAQTVLITSKKKFSSTTNTSFTGAHKLAVWGQNSENNLENIRRNMIEIKVETSIIGNNSLNIGTIRWEKLLIANSLLNLLGKNKQ